MNKINNINQIPKQISTNGNNKKIIIKDKIKKIEVAIQQGDYQPLVNELNMCLEKIITPKKQQVDDDVNIIFKHTNSLNPFVPTITRHGMQYICMLMTICENLIHNNAELKTAYNELNLRVQKLTNKYSDLKNYYDGVTVIKYKGIHFNEICIIKELQFALNNDLIFTVTLHHDINYNDAFKETFIKHVALNLLLYNGIIHGINSFKFFLIQTQESKNKIKELTKNIVNDVAVLKYCLNADLYNEDEINY